jgi:zona occludens toxin (predicted ATPase)
MNQFFISILTNLFNLFNIRIWNHAYQSIDFLRLPRPQGERRTEHEVRARRSQNQFTPIGVGVNKLIFKRFGISFNSFKKSTQIKCHN